MKVSTFMGAYIHIDNDKKTLWLVLSTKFVGLETRLKKDYDASHLHKENIFR